MTTSTDLSMPDLDGYPPEDDRDSRGTVPPQNIGAERSVLGAMMMSRDAVGECLSVLSGKDFYKPSHETIFDAILTVFGNGEPVDALTVGDRLAKAGDLARAGGQAYLHQLINDVPTTANASYYAEIVKEKSGFRALIEAGMRVVQLGSTPGDLDSTRAEAEAALYAATGSDKQQSDTSDLMTVVTEAMDAVEAAAAGNTSAVGVPTGFIDFDRITNGLHPGQLVIIAARPAIGKSTFAIDIARAAAIGAGQATAVFSLEMSKQEIGMRILSAEASVQLQHLRKGTLTDAHWTALARSLDKISNAPLFVDDSANLTMPEIRAKARKLKQQHNLKMIVIDYLQLMTSGKRVESRQQEVSEFSRALKLLAKELQIPVIALSQLNRGPEQRADKKPQMSDLRESGSIEQDADMVVLLHREDAYDKETDKAGTADLILAKHRNGPTDTITVAFQGHYSRFTNMAY